MAMMFLHFLHASYGGSHIQIDFGIWLDIGREVEGEREGEGVHLRRQGVGLKETLERLGYGFIKCGKVDWKAWAFVPNMTKAILFQHNALAKSCRAYNPRIKDITGIHHRYRMVFTWLGNLLRQKRDQAVPEKIWRRRELFDATSAVWKWISQIIIWEFQKEVLDAVKASLTPDRIPEEWIPNNIKFSHDGMKSFWHVQNMVFVDNPERSPLERSRHLWCWADRRAWVKWDKKKYRVLYRDIVLFWNQQMEIHGWKWSHPEFLKFFASICWIWPNNTTEKWFILKQGERVWFSLSNRTQNWEHPENWISGHKDDTKAGLPYELNIKFLTMEPDALIAHIQVRAGFPACFGYQLYNRYGWKWGWSNDRDKMTKPIDNDHLEQHHRNSRGRESEKDDVIFLREQHIQHQHQGLMVGENQEEEVVFVREQPIFTQEQLRKQRKHERENKLVNELILNYQKTKK